MSIHPSLSKFTRALMVSLLLWPQLPDRVWACTEYKSPSMCDDIAHEEAFWIGEYWGRELSFEMTLNGTRHDPSRETEGTLTLFEMNGRLGFDGGGAFKGEADLGMLHSGDEALQTRPGFEFLFDDSIRGGLRKYGDEYCTFEFWPRWTGTFKPPQSPTMSIELVGLNGIDLLGHVYFDGIQDGTLVHISSTFVLTRLEPDVTGWETVSHPDGSAACSRCYDDDLIGSVWRDCPAD